MLCGSLNGTGVWGRMGGVFGGEWIRVYAWLSYSAVHPKLSLLIGYTPTQNKKLKKKNKLSQGLHFLSHTQVMIKAPMCKDSKDET